MGITIRKATTGRKGLKGASTTDKNMWDEMQADWQKFTLEVQQAMYSFGVSTNKIETANNFFTTDQAIDYTGTNKLIQTNTRVDQEFFRHSVLSAYNNKCCISGLAIPSLLIASHIVPWRIDEKNRLNPRNGLCLSMLHDKAFDIGIITIAEDMTVHVSQKYFTDTDQFFRSALLAYNGKPIALPEKFRPDSEFLTYHRQHIFEI